VTQAPEALPPADRHSAFANAPMGVALCTPEGVLLDVNRFLERMLGRPVDQLRGRSNLEFMHVDDVPDAIEAWQRLSRTPDRPVRFECRLVQADGRAVPVQTTSSWAAATGPGDEPHIVAFIEDITDRKLLEAQLVHRSLHDPLTGLPNRFLYRDRLLHALERGHREDTPTCVLVIDLDGFKAINDLHGHAVGDAVLVGFADRLRGVLRASDTAARLGGDEFSIVCENTDRADAEVLADRLRRSARDPMALDGTTVQLGMSIGIGVAVGGSDPDEVLDAVVREADDAMYADKSERRRL
jgi:diguanylate cyclase (GGDEF)-like protein/PAS domain S-box-containing protein